MKFPCTSISDAQNEQISFLLLLYRELLQRSFKANWSGTSQIQTAQHHLYPWESVDQRSLESIKDTRVI